MRPLKDRLIFELNSVRNELLESASRIKTEELDYAPGPGMRTLRGQLEEIGSTELQDMGYLISGKSMTWQEAQQAAAGATAEQLLTWLDTIRQETLDYLNSSTDAQLSAPIKVPDSWASYLGAENLEPEEVVRWIARHEYYHAGQIVSYRWAQGHDPYKEQP